MAGIAEDHSLKLLVARWVDSVSAVFGPSPPSEGAQVQHWLASWHGSPENSLQTLGDQPRWPDAPWMRGTGLSCELRGAPVYLYRSDYAAIKGKSRGRRDLSLNNCPCLLCAFPERGINTSHVPLPEGAVGELMDL